jgi:hypothetical protein
VLGTFGDVGKNALRLSKTADWDVQISKYFYITTTLEAPAPLRIFQRSESAELGAREHELQPPCATNQISAFDKLNGNSSFGTFRAGQAGDARIAQFAVKIIF